MMPVEAVVGAETDGMDVMDVMDVMDGMDGKGASVLKIWKNEKKAHLES